MDDDFPAATRPEGAEEVARMRGTGIARGTRAARVPFLHPADLGGA